MAQRPDVEITRLVDVIDMFIERQRVVDRESHTSNTARWTDTDPTKVDPFSFAGNKDECNIYTARFIEQIPYFSQTFPPCYTIIFDFTIS